MTHYLFFAFFSCNLFLRILAVQLMKRTAALALAMVVSTFICSSCANSRKIHSLNELQKRQVLNIPYVRVHFPTDSVNVVKTDRTNLEKNAEWMKNNEDAVVILEGHCDERGSDEYNLELGDRRARSVKAELIRLGVNEEKLSTIISFGEKKPIDPHHNPAAWQKNRRVEFVLR